MKDRLGNEVEVGDRVRFPIGSVATGLNKIGKIEHIIGDKFYIWAVGDERSTSSWIRLGHEVELIT